MNETRATEHSLSLDDPPSGPVGRDDTRSFASEGDTFQHYQVLRREDGSLWELGRGAMGVTYKAFDTNLRCHVALKVISAHYLHSEMAGQRFIREARIAARVRHPNIAAVYHLGVDPQGFFYSMEFIDGETLENLVGRVGPLPLETVLRIGLQVARALAAASRQGLIHRDIKPANLMVLHQDEDGEDRLLVKMIDFGLARSYGGDDSHPQLTSTGFVGTPLYASPEQLEEKDLDVRSDIYSLGVTLWILLTGQPPFAGKMTQVITQHLHAPPPWWQLGECGEAVRTLLERMLHKNRLERYQTANELRLAIESCLRCVTGKDVLSTEGAETAESDRSLASPARVSAAARSTETVADGVSVPYLLGAIASKVGSAVKSHASASMAALVSSSRDRAGRPVNGSPTGRTPVQLRSPLLGVVAVALCIGGLVYWHSLTGAAAARSVPLPSAPKIVPTLAAASMQPAAAAGEPTPPRAIKTESAATETPAPTPTAFATPVADPVASNEPAANSTEDAPAAPDGLASLDGSPTNAPEASVPASPASSPAMSDEHDDAQDGNASTPTKRETTASHSIHTHRSSRPAPTPAPNFFQKLFGIKPKPKSK